MSFGNVEAYLSQHRREPDITAVKAYFSTVIDWVGTVFSTVESEMCGLEWARLYELYHSNPYAAKEVSAQLTKLYGDSYVKNRRGVFEYILGGQIDTKLLEIRIFDTATSRSTYEKQTRRAKKNATSNCPLCALGEDSNKSKIWGFAEMEADHVAAWSKGGATSSSNCQMLCKTHNRAKGNK